MNNIAIVLGSTRPNRNGEAVAKWIYKIAHKRGNATFELVDLKDYNLPLLDEPIPASQGKYSKEHTKKWAAKIASFDAYVFVTPEYNHSMPGALKNAIDFLYKEWNNKVAGFVGYGSSGGGTLGGTPTLSNGRANDSRCMCSGDAFSSHRFCKLR